MKSKKFDYYLYNKYDQAGKDSLKRFFESKGFTVKEEPFGKFGVDLEATKGEQVIYIDSEVRTNWSSGQFPFKTVHLPLRKHKMFSLENLYFATIREDLEEALFFTKEDIDLMDTDELDNKYMEKETFFNIPVERCKKRCLKNIDMS